MKLPLLTVLIALAALPAFAQSSLPGLKELLSETEWKRAGLDRLSADEIGVIDAALVRQQVITNKRHEAEISTVRQTASTDADKKASPTLFERFGLSTRSDSDWRSQPALKARVVKWETANRFLLDNGQAWEGQESIVYDIVGKNIAIEARPMGQFALIVEGANTKIRVQRVR